MVRTPPRKTVKFRGGGVHRQLAERGETPAWHFSSNVAHAWAMASKGLGVSHVMIILKTWSNAWCTTTRFHELHSWPCIFGCSDREDSLQHYLNCSHFWSGVCSREWAHVDPAVRLGLERPTGLRLRLVIVASRVYHTIKFNHRTDIENALSSGNFERVREISRILAAHFRQEMGIT